MFAQLLFAFATMIVSYALQGASQPKPQNAVSGELDVPTAEEGGNVPVIFGTVMLKDPNVVWYGDSRVQPIRTKSGKK